MTDAWSENFGGSGSRFAMGGGVTRVAGEEEAVPAWDENFGTTRRSQAPIATGPKPPDYKDPKTEGWLEWVGKNITGRVDPRFADAPAISRVLENEIYDQNSDAARSAYRNITLGQSLTPDDEAHANIVKNALGNRFIGAEKDAYGADVVRYRDKDGQEAVAYVNKPGLDMEDVNNFGLQSVPYLLAARFARGLGGAPGKLGQMLAQGTSAGATSVLGDAAALGYGSEKAPDPIRAGLVAGFGAGAEMLGPAAGGLWRRFVTEPKYFNRGTGTLTPEGEAAAKAAGFDPASMTREFADDFAKQLARTGSPETAAKSAAANEFKIPRTVGEITDNKDMLLREQQMVGGTYGQTARETMAKFRADQERAINNAVFGQLDDGRPGIARQLAPGNAGEITPSVVGTNIKEATRSARARAGELEKEAWEKVGPLEPTDYALQDLPAKIQAEIGPMRVDAVRTPKAHAMAEDLDAFMNGTAPGKGPAVLGSQDVRDINMMRKRLLTTYQGAQTKDDIAAAKAVYDGFNSWIGDAADKLLLVGDANAAAAMRSARGISREIHEIFDGKKGTPSAGILKQVLEGADSPEAVLNALISGPASKIKNGAPTALSQLKQAYTKYLDEPAAKAAWDDIRLAYWMRIAGKKTGEVAGPGTLASSIKTAMSEQRTIMNQLYTPQEIGQMQRLAGLLEQAARKNPNTSWSGVSIGSVMKDVANTVVTMLTGGESVLAKTVGRFALKPVADSYGAARASVATGGGRGAQPRTVNPSFGPLGAATSATIDRERNQSPRNLWQ